jgi:hypothetical protein
MSNLPKIQEAINQSLIDRKICSTDIDTIISNIKAKVDYATSLAIYYIQGSIKTNLTTLFKNESFIEICNDIPNDESDKNDRITVLSYLLIGVILNLVPKGKMNDTKSDFNTKIDTFIDTLIKKYGGNNTEYTHIFKQSQLYTLLQESKVPVSGGRRKTKYRKNLRKRNRRSKKL